MQWLTNPYVFPMLAAGLIGLALAFFIFRRRKVVGALPLLGMILSVTEWALAYTFELAGRDLGWQVFWAKVEYFGIVSVSVMVLIFALQYAQMTKWLTRRNLLLLWIFPVVCLILVWTNQFHGLIWTRIGQEDFGTYRLLTLGHGPFFWLLIAYSYAMLLSGSLILFRRAATGWAEFTFQAVFIILGVMVSWLGNFLYITGLNPVPQLDWTPLGLILSGVLFSVAVFRFGMLDIMPIAGEAILESLDDVVIVMNAQDLIVYVNQAFEYYLGVNPVGLVGRPAAEAFAPWPALQKLAGQHAALRSEIQLTPAGRDPVVFDVRISSIRWMDRQLLGRALVLEDITERRLVEGRIAQQESLEPRLIDIPLMVVYRAGDEKIVDVNRSFLVKLGYERKNVVGCSLLELGLWDAYQRADFQRSLLRWKMLKDYPLRLTNSQGNPQSYRISLEQVDLQGVGYLVLLAQEAGRDN